MAAPEGGTSGYTYSADFNDNVTKVTRTPKPGSPLAPLVTTYSYDSIYNKPTQIVDPLGLVTSMSYDGATGNLTTSISDVGSSPHLNARRSFAHNNRHSRRRPRAASPSVIPTTRRTSASARLPPTYCLAITESHQGQTPFRRW